MDDAVQRRDGEASHMAFTWFSHKPTFNELLQVLMVREFIAVEHASSIGKYRSELMHQDF